MTTVPCALCANSNYWMLLHHRGTGLSKNSHFGLNDVVLCLVLAIQVLGHRPHRSLIGLVLPVAMQRGRQRGRQRGQQQRWQLELGQRWLEDISSSATEFPRSHCR
jgi:hypothetical protein